MYIPFVWVANDLYYCTHGRYLRFCLKFCVLTYFIYENYEVSENFRAMINGYVWRYVNDEIIFFSSTYELGKSKGNRKAIKNSYRKTRKARKWKKKRERNKKIELARGKELEELEKLAAELEKLQKLERRTKMDRRTRNRKKGNKKARSSNRKRHALAALKSVFSLFG